MKRFEALAIEGWSPEFGSPVETEGEEVPAEQVDAGVELPVDEWRPLPPGEGAAIPGRVFFVDGVRRIEARVWMSDQDESRLGICASYAAGVVRCGRKAEIVSAEVRRGFFGRAGVPNLVTRVGTFPACVVADDAIEQLVNGLQERMGQLEVEVAGGWSGRGARVAVRRAWALVRIPMAPIPRCMPVPWSCWTVRCVVASASRERSVM